MSKFATPGASLPNGATVVAARPVHGQEREYIILALTNGMAGHPYVTWRMYPSVGDTHAVVMSGDYTMTFEGAIRSFAARSGFLVETLGGGIGPDEDVRLTDEDYRIAEDEDRGTA